MRVANMLYTKVMSMDFIIPGYMGEAVCRHHCAGDSYTTVCVPTDKGFVATIRSQRSRTINLG